MPGSKLTPGATPITKEFATAHHSLIQEGFYTEANVLLRNRHRPYIRSLINAGSRELLYIGSILQGTGNLPADPEKHSTHILAFRVRDFYKAQQFKSII